MSAVALFSTQSHTVLVSDGLAINTEGLTPSKDMVIPEDRIVDRNTRKVSKVNQQTGIAWTGSLVTRLPTFTEQLNPNQPTKEIAKQLTDLIRKKIAVSYSHLMRHDWFNVNAHVIGYENGTPMYHHIVKKNGTVVLEPGHQLPEGAATCSIPFCDNGQQLYNDYLRNNFTNGMHIKDLAVGAFKQLISEHSRQGQPLGGEIFTEVLTP